MALLIDIEGIDGSGKGTQAQMLCARFAAAGVAAKLISFPRYEATLFGGAVGEFLNGAFGKLADVHPFLVSLLFAGDRFESKEMLERALAGYAVVVLDRYVPSNVAHQASKRHAAERDALIKKILHIEYGIYRLPLPDVCLLLDLPVPMAQQLIARKSPRSYTAKTADLQEADAAYLAQVREVYHHLATGPNWRTISCSDENGLRTVAEISDEIWSAVGRRS